MRPDMYGELQVSSAYDAIAKTLTIAVMQTLEISRLTILVIFLSGSLGYVWRKLRLSGVESKGARRQHDSGMRQRSIVLIRGFEYRQREAKWLSQQLSQLQSSK